MNQIKCPNCQTEFTIDEDQYADILTQVKTKEFNEELEQRIIQYQDHQKSKNELFKERISNEYKEELVKKEAEINSLNNKIAASDQSKELEITKVEIDMKGEISKLTNKISELETINKSLQQQKLLEIENALAIKDKEVQELENRIKAASNEKELALKNIEAKLKNDLFEKDKQLNDLNSKALLKEKEGELELNSLKEKYQSELQHKEDTIAFYKDFKAKQNIKLLGESLEQHCEIEFNKIRMSAFPNAIFNKDNNSSDGTKGDYIYREFDKNGLEIISIMFEMKNESDGINNKKTNQSYFKKLNDDRNKKNCEYAVLVSMLEQDSEYYNNGIVDVSYEYDKMYVIRPQFFISLITLLRNASLKTLQYKNEVALMRQQTIDITNFEEELGNFQEDFSRNYNLAHRKFNDAIDGIDKTIKQLEKTKEALLSSDKNYRIASEKADKLSVKKLTKNNPTMKALFNELQSNDTDK